MRNTLSAVMLVSFLVIDFALLLALFNLFGWTDINSNYLILCIALGGLGLILPGILLYYLPEKVKE